MLLKSNRMWGVNLDDCEFVLVLGIIKELNWDDYSALRKSKVFDCKSCNYLWGLHV